MPKTDYSILIADHQKLGTPPRDPRLEPMTRVYAKFLLPLNILVIADAWHNFGAKRNLYFILLASLPVQKSLPRH